MMKKIAALIAIGAQLALGNANAATTLTFDDLPGTYSSVPDGYGGFSWNDVLYANGRTASAGSGYDLGAVSRPNIIFANPWGGSGTFSSTISFSLLSADVTKAWYSGIVHFSGYNGSSLIYSMDVSAASNAPTHVNFNWRNLTSVTFGSDDGGGTAIDNLKVAAITSAVPEPETYGMMLSGLGLIGAIARRRKQKPSC